MFDSLAALVPRPAGLPERAHRLAAYRRVLDGTIYDTLPAEFHAERNAANEYVPLRQRKPSVRYALCRLVVEDSVAFLFGEGRFPAIECTDKSAQDMLALLMHDAHVQEVFAVAAAMGSVGSVAVRLRVLRSRLFLDAMPTECLTPIYDPERPDTLVAVVEAYQVRGYDLRSAGYAVADKDVPASFWHRRQWTAEAETWFQPQHVDSKAPPTVDAERSVHHGLGFVPIVWIRNLAGGVEPDGACTFRGAIETGIEIDYQLSQAGRGLKYSSDPTLLIKEPAVSDAGDTIVRSASDALVVSEKGDAKLLEISGTAAAAVIEYVRALREMALESVHGNRANADRLGAAQSGRAQELLYAPLLNLVDRLRTSYGRGLLEVAGMIARVAQRMPVLVDDEEHRILAAPGRLTLRWPPFFAPTHQDMRDEATTLTALRRGGMMSEETAVRRTAATYDIGDADAELGRIAVDQAAADARATREGAQIKEQQPLPA